MTDLSIIVFAALGVATSTAMAFLQYQCLAGVIRYHAILLAPPPIQIAAGEG